MWTGTISMSCCTRWRAGPDEVAGMSPRTAARILAVLLLVAALLALHGLYKQVALIKSRDLKPREPQTRVIYQVPPEVARRLAEQAEASRSEAGPQEEEPREEPPTVVEEAPAPGEAEMPLPDDGKQEAEEGDEDEDEKETAGPSPSGTTPGTPAPSSP